MNIGKRLSEIRKAHNISATALEDRINISQQNISNYETNRVIPNYETLKIILNYFKITLSEFFSDIENEPELPPETRLVISKIKELPIDKIRILNDVIDTWEKE